MKAVYRTAYGSPDVLHVTETETPRPQANEILVRVHAVHINYGDLLSRKFDHRSLKEFNMPYLLWLLSRLEFGFRKPKPVIVGSEYAGEVAAVGAAVTRFTVGDAVFGYTAASMGAHAEYLCVREDGMVAHKPANLSFEEAAALPYGALTALNLLKVARLQPGQRVLINGASGGIGSAAVQLARHAGAVVTGVCGSTRAEYVRALGAHHVIDYARQDFTQGTDTYDLILDVLGKGSFRRAKPRLSGHGRYLYASFKMKQVRQALWTKLTSSKKVICALSMEKPADLLHIKALAEAGALRVLVDRTFPLALIAEAHRYMESGQRTGSVVVCVAAAPPAL